MLMLNFIEEFYFGNIEPQICGENQRAANEQFRVLSVTEDKMMKSLTGENREYFRKYADTWDEVVAACSLDNFVSGFRLGSKFVYDTFVGKETVFADYLRDK